MMALTIAMAGDSVPKDRRGSAMGLMGTISAVGTALGPLVGGAMIAAFGWPAVFAVLAVMGVGALLMGSTLLPVDEKPVHEAAAHDGIGTVLLAVSLFAFTGLLTFGARLSASALLAGVALTALGFVAFGWHQTRTPSPLVRLELVRDRELRTGLISLALVSAIMMATLVVGPFYLSGVLGLGSFGTGLVMSVGPVVAALTGAPAGRLVDRAGSFRVMAGGLGAVTAGSVLLTVLPVPFGVGGYMTGLVVITFGYALFQAANTTAIMEGAPSDRRGVTSALLGLSRNIGLISGASAMGTVYAAGPRIAGGLGLGSSEEAGLQVTFITAIGLAGFALGLSLWRRRQQLQLLT
jgi:MFS family permease